MSHKNNFHKVKYKSLNIKNFPLVLHKLKYITVIFQYNFNSFSQGIDTSASDVGWDKYYK